MTIKKEYKLKPIKMLKKNKVKKKTKTAITLSFSLFHIINVLIK